MNQAKHVPYIKKLLLDLEYFKDLHTRNSNHVPRFIKIHGSNFQENGLPDIMILTPHVNFWLELKRDWKDHPSAIQKYNILSLAQYGFVTGFVVDDEYKSLWEDEEPIKLIDIIKHKLK